MVSSRKILLGSSAIITSKIFQMIAESVADRNAAQLDQMSTKNGLIHSDATDQILEATHWQMLALLVGNMLAVVLFLVGAILLAIALYQTARTVERLQNPVTPINEDQ